ncbi:MAG: DUF3343 domain-containing protein [Ruthenibacterium sp.]
MEDSRQEMHTEHKRDAAAPKPAEQTEYTATFFSHFGALRFARALTQEGIAYHMMPVPRALSSSCGTSVRFACAQPPAHLVTEELEAIYTQGAAGWHCVCDNR